MYSTCSVYYTWPHEMRGREMLGGGLSNLRSEPQCADLRLTSGFVKLLDLYFRVFYILSRHRGVLTFVTLETSPPFQKLRVETLLHIFWIFGVKISCFESKDDVRSMEVCGRVFVCWCLLIVWAAWLLFMTDKLLSCASGQDRSELVGWSFHFAAATNPLPPFISLFFPLKRLEFPLSSTWR